MRGRTFGDSNVFVELYMGVVGGREALDPLDFEIWF